MRTITVTVMAAVGSSESTDETSSTKASNATISTGITRYSDGIFVDLQVEGEMIKFLVDTGSSISVMSLTAGRTVAICRNFPCNKPALQL